MSAGRPSPLRLLAFAGGDFAFNLYWQSVMLYLLFYYTEALHLPLAQAARCYALASVWDGVASLAVGLMADRFAGAARLRWALVAGAVPLGASFVATYAAPPLAGAAGFAWILAAHIVFRTLYALVNIPYLALSARIGTDERDRALVAGARMVFGTGAAVCVAWGTLPLGRLLTGGEGPQAYAATAAVFAVIASAGLTLVGLSYREGTALPPPARVPMPAALGLALRNRAFATLAAATMAMIVAVTVLDKSVLYYFKYALGDQRAGQLALGWMMAVSGVAVPLWVAAARRRGARAVWVGASALCLAALLSFVLGKLETPGAVQGFLIAMQTGIVGLNFALWALLPEAIDRGAAQFGVRVEAAIYGLSALLQRLAIGLGTLLLGQSLPGGPHHGGDAGFRLTIAFIPLVFFALSAALIATSPLRRPPALSAAG